MKKRMTITLETNDGLFEATFPVGYIGDVLVLDDCGTRFISVIKQIRTFTGWGLREAKLAADKIRDHGAAAEFTTADAGGRGTLTEFATELSLAGARFHWEQRREGDDFASKIIKMFRDEALR